MDEAEAEGWVQNTFSGKYDNENFRNFINQLVGNYSHGFEWRDKTYAGNRLPESHAKLIESYKYLCRFLDGVNEVGVFVVKLRKFKTLERARSFQRSFIARQMEKFGKDAALVAFYTDDKDEWRFSYVRLQYKLSGSGVGKYLSPVRRSSFLVGDTVRKHTAERQLITLLLSNKSMSLALLEKAFSIEPVTNEFFSEYNILYEKLLSHLQERIDAGLQFKNEQGNPIKIEAEDFAKHLLGQLVFLYFLQKKRWLGAPRGDYFDQGDTDFLHNLYEKKDYNNFYDDKLTYLLHDALATDRTKKNDNDYYPLFACKIPYLNGGLFEPFAGYDWQQQLNISNDIFEDIFETFDNYNFTVREDEPLENEVAIDPEMLGKVFENLIPENDRKGKGTFYTPREIVYYMCQEALIDYLHGCFEDPNSCDDSDILKSIKEFIIYCDTMQEHNAMVQEKRANEEASTTYKELELPKFIKETATEIDKALQDVRICDPAIGSGAFPVAMMLEIVRLRMALDKAVLNKELTAYQCKLHCIENCLYGVDMEYSAVDIARLRFWLSLTIEEERDDTQKDRIAPLPNLDYKIIQANALLRKHSQQLFSPNFNDYEESKRKYFSEGDKRQKPELKEKITAEREALFKNDYDIKSDFSEIFHEDNDNAGFDIILANPPYIQLQKDNSELGNFYKPLNYDSFVKSGDIYTLFYERAIELLKQGGRLAYITSNKWMRTAYGKNIREIFTEKTTPIALIDLGSNAFDTATVDSNILIARKGQKPLKDDENIIFRAATIHDHKNQDLYQYMQDKENIVDMHLPEDDEQWLILSEAEQALLQKIESIGTPLKQWDIVINSGVKTAYNEAFVIDTETKKRLIAEDSKSEEIIKPVLRGRDIERWRPDWQGQWLIASHNGYPHVPRIDIAKDYPAIYGWLLQCEEKSKHKKTSKVILSTRADKGKHWTNLRSCAYQAEFEKAKIIYPELNQSCSFVYDTNNSYLLNSAYMLNSDSVNLKNLTAFLNSNISQFWLSHNCTSLGNRGRRMLAMFLNELPIYEKINDCDELGAITDAITKGEDIQKHEAHLNKILYKLYDITKDEIEILEKISLTIAN